MSEGRDGREDQGITSPEVDENHGMGDISPVMSYERGNDYLERTTSEGEPKYKGKGKAICMPVQCKIYEILTLRPS